MARANRQDEGYGLGKALLWSALLHVPLLLLVWLFLLSSASSLDVARAEEEIRFTFDPATMPEPLPEAPAPEPEPAVETTEPPDDETSIFDRGPQPESEEIPESRPEPSRLGDAATEALFRDSAPPPAEPSPFEEETADEPVEIEPPEEATETESAERKVEIPDDEPEPRPEVVDQPEGIELPETGADSYRSPPDEEPSRRFETGAVIRDLQRYLARGGSPRAPSEETEGEAGNPEGIDMPDLQDLPYTDFGLGPPVFESTDYDWSDYGRVVYTAIRRAWFARLYATHESFDRWAWGTNEWFLKHLAGLRFVIERNGETTSIRVLQGSGCEPLDASARNAQIGRAHV